jgi:hypothetical protein
MLSYFGLTRFSVVTETNRNEFRATRRSPSYADAANAVLFDKRLDQRFALFETFALPSIRTLMSREPGYWHFIAISDRLPERYATHMRSLLGDLPRVRTLVIGQHDDVRDAFRAAVAGNGSEAPVFTFRLDDDDALADNYLELVRGALEGCSRDVVVAIDDGFLLETAGGLYRLRKKNAPRIALGLGLLSMQQQRTIFDLGNHTKIDERISAIHIRDRRGWVNVKHDYSDVQKWRRRLIRRFLARLPASRVMAELGPHFAHIRLER